MRLRKRGRIYFLAAVRRQCGLPRAENKSVPFFLFFLQYLGLRPGFVRTACARVPVVTVQKAVFSRN
jgi:hypothetical protein